MKSTHRLPVVSAVTLGLLFCATPAVATTLIDPSPSAASSTATVIEDTQPSKANTTDTDTSGSLSVEDDVSDRSTIEPQDADPSTSAQPANESSPSSDPTDDDVTADLLPETGSQTFQDGELLLEPAEHEFLSEEFMTLEDEEFWRLIEALGPEGSQYWDDAQWEAFYETPEGQDYLDAFDELFSVFFPDNGDDWDTEAWEAYWAEFEAIFPEGSENWDDAQWEAFLLTPEGEKFLDDFFALLFRDLDETEIAELLDFFDALLAELLFELEEEQLNRQTAEPSPTPNPVATETTTEAKPAAVTTTDAALATTGSDGVRTLVGLGVLLSLFGVGLVAGQRRLQARKSSRD